MEILAHRGASHDAPENTLAAIRLAWLQGADAVELDVHRTADDRLVVIHDPDTIRTTGVAGRVADATGEELQLLDAGRWKGDAFAGERIPTLDAALATVPVSRRVYLELKVDGPALGELVRTLARSRLAPPQVVVITFDLEVARTAKRLLPRSEVCWLIERAATAAPPPVIDWVKRARAAALDGLGLEATWVDEASLRCLRAAGLTVHAWTVDDAAVARRLAALGVDGITTNRPGWLREQLTDLLALR